MTKLNELKYEVPLFYISGTPVTKRRSDSSRRDLREIKDVECESDTYFGALDM